MNKREREDRARLQRRDHVSNSRSRRRTNDLPVRGSGESRVQRRSGTTRAIPQNGAAVEPSNEIIVIDWDHILTGQCNSDCAGSCTNHVANTAPGLLGSKSNQGNHELKDHGNSKSPWPSLDENRSSPELVVIDSTSGDDSEEEEDVDVEELQLRREALEGLVKKLDESDNNDNDSGIHDNSNTDIKDKGSQNAFRMPLSPIVLTARSSSSKDSGLPIERQPIQPIAQTLTTNSVKNLNSESVVDFDEEILRTKLLIDVSKKRNLNSAKEPDSANPARPNSSAGSSRKISANSDRSVGSAAAVKSSSNKNRHTSTNRTTNFRSQTSSTSTRQSDVPRLSSPVLNQQVRFVQIEPFPSPPNAQTYFSFPKNSTSFNRFPTISRTIVNPEAIRNRFKMRSGNFAENKSTMRVTIPNKIKPVIIRLHDSTSEDDENSTELPPKRVRFDYSSATRSKPELRKDNPYFNVNSHKKSACSETSPPNLLETNEPDLSKVVLPASFQASLARLLQNAKKDAELLQEDEISNLCQPKVPIIQRIGKKIGDKDIREQDSTDDHGFQIRISTNNGENHSREVIKNCQRPSSKILSKGMSRIDQKPVGQATLREVMLNTRKTIVYNEKETGKYNAVNAQEGRNKDVANSRSVDTMKHLPIEKQVEYMRLKSQILEHEHRESAARIKSSPGETRETTKVNVNKNLASSPNQKKVLARKKSFTGGLGSIGVGRTTVFKSQNESARGTDNCHDLSKSPIDRAAKGPTGEDHTKQVVLLKEDQAVKLLSTQCGTVQANLTPENSYLASSATDDTTTSAGSQSSSGTAELSVLPSNAESLILLTGVKPEGSESKDAAETEREALFLREKLLKAKLIKNMETSQKQLNLIAKENQVTNARTEVINSLNGVLSKGIKLTECKISCQQLESQVNSLQQQLKVANDKLREKKYQFDSVKAEFDSSSKTAYEKKEKCELLEEECKLLGEMIKGSTYLIPKRGKQEMVASLDKAEKQKTAMVKIFARKNVKTPMVPKNALAVLRHNAALRARKIARKNHWKRTGHRATSSKKKDENNSSGITEVLSDNDSDDDEVFLIPKIRYSDVLTKINVKPKKPGRGMKKYEEYIPPLNSVAGEDKGALQDQMLGMAVQKIDPTITLCTFELRGICNSEACSFQHLYRSNQPK